MKYGAVINFAGLGFTLREEICSNYINLQGGTNQLLWRIKKLIKRHSMDYLLLETHDSVLLNKYPDYPDFIFVKLIEFIMRYSKIINKPTPISNSDFQDLLRMSAEYSLNEIKINKKDGIRASDEDYASFLLKTIGTQARWDYAINNRFPFYRTIFLYDQLIKDENSPKFIRNIVGAKFEKDFGVPLMDFVKIGFVLFSGSNRRGGLSRSYLEKARAQRMPIPEDEVVRVVLEQVACDKKKFKDDSEFKRFNLNPLLKFPLIRPWKNSDLEKPGMDRFIAPIPDLVLYRFTAGIYFQFLNFYKMHFTTAFGDLFELYVNQLLNWYKLPNRIISEKEIELFYKGKKPDWVIFDNDGIILLECKATQYTQSMYEHGIEASCKGCISQLQKAIKQLESFQSYIPDLGDRFSVKYHDLPIQKIIITYEPLFGLERGPLRNMIDDKDDWSALGVWELEAIQPYIAKGANFWKYLQERRKVTPQDFSKILDNMERETGANRNENELLKYGERIFNELLKNQDTLNN